MKIVQLIGLAVIGASMIVPMLWVEHRVASACEARGGVYKHDMCLSKDVLR